MLKSENSKAFGYAFLFTIVLLALIVIGSRQLSHFDAALVAYTFACLFAVFGLTYRYSMWLQRPPTALYWKRGWQVFLRRGHRRRNASLWVRRLRRNIFGRLSPTDSALLRESHRPAADG